MITPGKHRAGGGQRRSSRSTTREEVIEHPSPKPTQGAVDTPNKDRHAQSDVPGVRRVSTRKGKGKRAHAKTIPSKRLLPATDLEKAESEARTPIKRSKVATADGPATSVACSDDKALRSSRSAHARIQRELTDLRAKYKARGVELGVLKRKIGALEKKITKPQELDTLRHKIESLKNSLDLEKSTLQEVRAENATLKKQCVEYKTQLGSVSSNTELAKKAAVAEARLEEHKRSFEEVKTLLKASSPADLMRSTVLPLMSKLDGFGSGLRAVESSTFFDFSPSQVGDFLRVNNVATASVFETEGVDGAELVELCQHIEELQAEPFKMRASKARVVSNAVLKLLDDE